nr:PREDICTED: TLD domain-containing protein 1 [Bemisia tabaci]
MGNQSAKTSSKSFSNVSPNELAIIESTIHKSNDIKQNDVQKVWSEYITPTLLQNYSRFIFSRSPQNSPNLNLKSFTILLSELGRGSSDQQAAALYLILRSSEEVTAGDMEQYVIQLLQSCFKILEKKQNKSYLKWKKIAADSFDSDVSGVSSYLCQDLKRENNVISEDFIANWLAQCQMIHLLHSFVILHLYGLYQSQESSGQQMPFFLPNLKLLPGSENATSQLSLPGILFLNQLLPVEFQRDWRLLFSSNLHGESFSMMQKYVLEQGPSVIIVRDSDGHVFGGFANDSWRLGPKFYGDSSCFLFTLSPRFSVSRSTGYNSHYMYINTNQSTLPNGLGMGGQFDYWGLWIDSEFGVGACSNTCTTFDNYTCLSKDKNFHIASLEVWGVGIPPPTAAERGEREVGKSILDKDPTASSILEIAGKTRHSDGLRDRPDDEM